MATNYLVKFVARIFFFFSQTFQMNQFFYPSLSKLIAILFISGNLILQAQGSDKPTSLAEKKSAEYQLLRSEALRLADSLGIPVRLEPDEFTIIELQYFLNGYPMYYATDNIIAAQTLSTHRVWPGGAAGLSLTGSSETLGIWDGGRTRIEHQEFQGRAMQQDGASSNSSHATHVGGTMIAAGVSSDAKGMSYQALLDAYDWNNDVSEMAQAAANGLRVSNHSYGYITGWRYNYLGDSKWTWFGDTTVSTIQDYGYGFYDQSAQNWDEVAFNAPYYLIVKSAGNNRGSGPSSQPVDHWVWTGGTWTLSTAIRELGGGEFGYDCIPYNGVAKNILTVGAVNDIPGGYNIPGDVQMSSFSSWGPTDDGRIKPDIVGNGVGLYSSTAGSNTSYSSYSGTSMSSPNISGSIGLLLNHYRNIHGNDSIKAATMKALIIHTADEAGPDPGPDYIYGWGLMNTMKAALLMTNDSIEGLDFHIRELSISQDQTIEVEVEASGLQALKASIVWTDTPGTPVPPALNPPDLMLVNDLDLRISDASNSIYLPFILDPANPAAAATTADNFRDNVEVVLIEQPNAGQRYTINISHKGILTDGNQDFSLIVSGNVPITYSCPPPSGLDVTNITYNTALLSWMPGGSENEWTLEWGEAGFEPGNGNLLEGLQQPLWGLSTLVPGTAYEFIVKAICSQEDISIWAGPESFSTLCDSIPASITIMADTNNFCGAILVTYSATIQNGGDEPAYQWLVNGEDAGENASLLSYYPQHNDVVACLLTSSHNCVSNNPAMSNEIVMTVYQIPIVSWQSFSYDTVCINWPLLELNGGDPPGGIYSGPGVENGWFDPAAAGSGTHTLYYIYTSDEGCVADDSLQIFVDYCTQINQMNNRAAAIAVFPNPASKQLFVENTTPTAISEIKILDVYGRVVLQKTGPFTNKTTAADISLLKPGLYVIEITTFTDRFFQKIFIR
jgi:hypothetical protein